MALQDSNKTNSIDQTEIAMMYGANQAIVDSDGFQYFKGNVTGFPSANIDAFGRLRVSNPKNLFDSAFYYDLNPLAFDTSTANSGTIAHNNNEKNAVLTTAAVANSSAIMQSFSRMKYHAGRSNIILISGNFGAGVSGVTKRVGQFDASNGYFLQVTSTAISFVIRSKTTGAVVDTVINQASWNLDTFNTLDITKQNILIVDYQWLGSGRVRFGFVVDGAIRYCHQFLHANILSTLYHQTATLPMRFEIFGNGVATLKVSCCAVVTEGQDAVNGILRTVYTGTTGRSISGTTANFPLISLRKQLSFADIVATIEGINIFCGSSDDILVKLVKNATLTGASWTTTGGFCEFNRTATSYTGGTEVVSTYLRGASTSDSVARIADILKDTLNTSIGQFISGASEIITISISNITSTTTVHGTINYKEVV